MNALATAVLLIGLTPAAAVAFTPAGQPVASGQQGILRDWALARCLAKGFGLQTPAGEDAARSAAALLERGDYGMATYDRLETLVDRQLAKPYGGSTGGTYITLKCIDLYHSAQLASMIRGQRATPVR